MTEIKTEGIRSNANLSSTTMKAVWGDCLVCGDRGTGKHYGIVACEGCKGFFKRSIRKNLNYSCQGDGACPVDKVHRNRCQRCRLNKCLTKGMKKEAVQCERKPIAKSMENGTKENQLPSPTSPQSTNYLAIYQERTEHQFITPASTTSAPPPAPTNSLENHLSPFFSGKDYDSIISSEHLQFKLKPPTLGVSSLSMDYVYEIATRLLFLTVDWARSIQAFRSLESTDQLVLLQSTWSDLFMLGVAQCSSSFPMSPLLTLAAVHMENRQAEESNGDGKSTAMSRDPSLLDKVMAVKELLFSLEKLELDPVEYAYLKATALFNSDCSSLKNPKQVERLQEKAHCSLKLYVESKNPNYPERFAKILLRLPGTRMLTQRTAEELFFSPLIGTVRIESIMNNILSNSLTF